MTTDLTTLDQILAGAPADTAPRVPFAARVAGHPVSVTAVLQRTAVVEPPGSCGERSLCRLALVLADPAAVRFVVSSYDPQRAGRERGQERSRGRAGRQPGRLGGWRMPRG